MKDKKTTFLLVDTKTWEKDTHGLFDYEEKSNTGNSFTIRIPTNIVREGHNVKEIKDSVYSQNFEILCNVNNKNGKKTISNNKSMSLFSFIYIPLISK